jgi:hypothetical protein
MTPRIPSLALSLLAAFTGPLWAANSSLIQSPLSNTGVDPDAAGRAHCSLTEKSSELIVSVSKLTANTGYQIEVGGILEGTFTTNRSGAANVRFRAPNAGRYSALDFDPRGQQLRVLSGDQSVLEATLSGPGETAGAVTVERINLRGATGVTGKAEAEYRLDRAGRRTFKVELSRVTPGTSPIELYVGGIRRGAFPANRLLSRIRFAASSTDPAVLPLDFDPRGLVVDVVRDGVVIFSSPVAAVARGVNVASPRLTKAAIPSTGADADGKAEAKLLIDAHARKHFSVEVENVPDGDYDLLVDGATVAQIVVSSGAEGSKGEVEFTTGEDNADELPLNFDPAGKILTVSQSGTVFFQGVFTPDTDSGLGTPKPEAASESEESITSTGLDTDGKAKAKYRVDDKGRHRFSVEVEDVPAGAYSLVVAGTVRGGIRVVSTGDGAEGELEFTSNAERGKRPLNFDPRGQLVEIVSASGTFFSKVLGSGPGAAGPATAPLKISVPLLSTVSGSSARAKAELKRKATGELRFAVDLENAEPGSYEVLVGDIVRGTLVVVSDEGGTRGDLEFEASPEEDQLPLDFDVAGRAVVISKDGAVLFSRVFPSL